MMKMSFHRRNHFLVTISLIILQSIQLNAYTIVSNAYSRHKISRSSKIFLSDQHCDDQGDDEIQTDLLNNQDDSSDLAVGSPYETNDLTDRFKYKVHALMGTFDPHPDSSNTENDSGNILNAMLTFPSKYSFTVVGRTGDDLVARESYIDKVKTAVLNGSGGDTLMECSIIPRGTNFVKISIEVTVESASVINSIYEELASFEQTVMKF